MGEVMHGTGGHAGWGRVTLFVASVLILGNLAGLNYHALEGLGGLLFILSPAVVTMVMRLSGDGWSDAGFRVRRQDLGLCLGALFLFPALFALALVLGKAFEAVSFGEGVVERLLLALIFGAPAILLYAFSEEFAWRGYLEPKLAALGLSALRRHLLVGAIWALWHLGYVLSLANQPAIPLRLYLPLFFLACLAMAVIYGQWRAKTGSFWPAAIAHGSANALAWPLLDPALLTVSSPLWFAARPEGLVVLSALTVIAVSILRRNA